MLLWDERPLRVDKDTGLIHSVETNFVNVNDITRVAQLLYGNVEVVHGDFGYQGIEKRFETADKSIISWVVLSPGKCLVLLDTPDGSLLDLVETALASGFCLQ